MRGDTNSRGVGQRGCLRGTAENMQLRVNILMWCELHRRIEAFPQQTCLSGLGLDPALVPKQKVYISTLHFYFTITVIVIPLNARAF